MQKSGFKSNAGEFKKSHLRNCFIWFHRKHAKRFQIKVIMYHVNHSQINSSKKCGFESHDRTKGFHRKTARQNRSQTNNHHLRQSFIWQLSLCGNYTLIFYPENAPYHCGSFWLYRTNLWGICCTFILLNFWTDPSWYHDSIVICLTVFDL